MYFSLENIKFSVQILRNIISWESLLEFSDEFHYLLNYTDAVIQNSRILKLSKYYQSNPNIIKFETLFNVTKKKEHIKISKFLNTIIERVNSPG